MFKVFGKPDADILVITDPPSGKVEASGYPISLEQLQYFAKVASSLGLNQKDFVFTNCCPHIPDEHFTTEGRKRAFMVGYRDQFTEHLKNFSPKNIITLGSMAMNQVSTKPKKITTARGQFYDYDFTDIPVFHMLSPGYVLRSPNVADIFASDFSLFNKAYTTGDVSFRGYDYDDPRENYKWTNDLSELLNLPDNIVIAVDTETTGLQTYRDDVNAFTAQISWQENQGIIFPVMESYYEEFERDHDDLISQFKEVMEDPRFIKTGHNFKYDYKMLKKLNINTQGWAYDSLQLAFNIDENMERKSLDDCVRLWVPEMSGYADPFNLETDKGNMIAVDKDKLRKYGCGDTDACLRLTKNLLTELKKDSKQYFLFKNVQMPALKAFADSLEANGVTVNEDKLIALGNALETVEQELYNEMIEEVPASIKRRHLAAKKDLSFNRSDFKIDILFGADGLNLKPVMMTDSGRPSVNKDHLNYFKSNPFVLKLISYSKLSKMRTTYVGKEDTGKGSTGFWQYLHNSKLYPTYALHNTKTGRSSSSNPNGQNLPKRGAYAKQFREIFEAPKGYSFISVDYSQAELRIAAWESNDPQMLYAFNNGIDLHTLTAASLLKMPLEEFLKLPEADFEKYRYRAKACNFGLLYLMSLDGFIDYAKSNYDLDLTHDEGEEMVKLWFKLYGNLKSWQNAKVKVARQHQYIRALHGAVRHLPDYNSNSYSVISATDRQAVNSGVQRFASDLGVIALTHITNDFNAHYPRVKPTMFIHDALVFLVPDELVNEASAYIKYYMEDVPFKILKLNPPIPMLTDIEVGKNLKDLVKLKDIEKIKPVFASV